MSDEKLRPGKLPAPLLRELLSGAAPPPPEVRLPPAVGEDAGVIDVPGGALVVAADPITLTDAGVGAHAALVNANDVAAMGARPRWFLAVVLLPPGTGAAEARALFAALHAALAGMDVALVGGHTEVTDAVARPVVVGQMMGLREDGGFVPTGGLSPGDAVLQVGPAPVEGAAVLAAAAARLPRGIPDGVLRAAARAIEDPGISVVAPALRAAELGARAMHDPTEGGLSAGLHELAEASGVALVVDESAVQWFEPGRRICRALGLDPWGVLASGALLAGFPPETVDTARRRLGADGHAAARIARAEAGRGVRLTSGEALVRHERDELSRLAEG